MISRKSVQPPRVINVVGIDGSGKSTVANHLATKLRSRGYEVDVIWLRFNHFFSKPLLGLCRLIKLTRYVRHGGVLVGYHDFHRSPLISLLFVILQYADALRVRLLKIEPKLRTPNKILIIDRYVFDILIDLMVDTNNEKLSEEFFGVAFKKLLPPNAFVLFIDRVEEGVISARPENSLDEKFQQRFRYYSSLREDDAVIRISNNGSLLDLLKKVDDLFVDDQ